MILASSNNTVTPIFLEGCLTSVAIALAFCVPTLADRHFTRIERAFTRLAQRKHLSVFLVGLTALVLRLAILPICPIPFAIVPDDFSFLFAADTFAHGHLSNPTPAMWIHFETIHVSMQPFYVSMYFPAQGLLLAAGKVLFGNPWYGLLITSALMCAALCWMLQVWLPARWALLGGILSIIHLGLFSYWINTYHAAGSIAALGGALVLAGLPRIKRTMHVRYGILMAIGMAVLAITRPYEGMLLCLPVAISLGRWVFTGKNRPNPGVLFRRAVFPLLILIGGVSWLGYYDTKAFGHPTTLPYTINRATYAMAPYFVWQSARPEPHYRHVAMRSFYYAGELTFFSKIHNRSTYLPDTLLKAGWALVFYAGLALLPPLVMLARVVRDRRLRFLIVCTIVMIPGMMIQIFLIPHYLAPFTAAFYAIGLQAMRHLRFWKPEGRPVGRTLSRLLVTVCLGMVVIRSFAGPLHLALPFWPVTFWNSTWYGPDHFGTERPRVESILAQQPGRQLVLVRYNDRHNPFDEWVYNAADIDHSPVIWAREMDSANNAELIQYYKDRYVWLVEPDTLPATVTPYTPQVSVPAALTASR